MVINATNVEQKPIYLVVSVMFNKLGAFMDSLSSGEDVDPDKYGKVLASGYGVITDEVRQKVADKYGFKLGKDVDMKMFIDPVFRQQAKEYLLSGGE